MSEKLSRVCLIFLLIIAFGCEMPMESTGRKIIPSKEVLSYFPSERTSQKKPILSLVKQDVALEDYFAFMDSLLTVYDSIGGMAITEHHLVMANLWILDSLRNTDYYYRLENRNEVVEDANKLIIIKKGIKLIIPDSVQITTFNNNLKNTLIDVNIPEYKLRIWQNDSLRYFFDVRVGKKEQKYLKMAGHEVSLQTPIGEGEIVRINKAPWFINPVDNKRYYKTRRDDGQYTQLPLIPWLEPSINGQRPGSLIHPTTNKSTLGKAASNGCVGLSEGDMWVVYYHAPIGTKVTFRYDLQVVTSEGDTLKLEDIYGGEKITKR